ncbi:hypothetical protein M5E88_11705 [Akkermansia muciniphila]|nr:hypothetical protein M5E88_11705 [Akkermansia muciniphila]
MVDLYHKTWEIAAGRVRKGPEGLPASPYMDENCYEDQIWIWDTCFMVLFAKYAPRSFPGVESLDNLYKPVHEKAVTPLKVHLVDNPRYLRGWRKNILTSPVIRTAWMIS